MLLLLEQDVIAAIWLLEALLLWTQMMLFCGHFCSRPPQRGENGTLES